MSKLNKKNIVILMGGPSAEHEVSLATGKKIFDGLAGNKYNIKPVIVAKNGKWLLPAIHPRINGAKTKRANNGPSISLEGRKALDKLKSEKGVDVVFIALHGTYGEDGAVQGMLELAGIPYTCSGVLASALAMDKEMTKKVLMSENILMPRHIILEKGRGRKDFKKIKPPVVVKPVNQGSSVGTFIVKVVGELPGAVKEAFKFGSRVIVEEFVPGREITAAVLGNKNPCALPLVEIKPKISNFFDYRAKYEVGGSQEICPAPLKRALTKKIQDIAVKVHRVLGCRGITRSDFILRGAKPYFLEINTIPGMTQTSLVPQAAARAGIPFSALLDNLIELALK